MVPEERRTGVGPEPVEFTIDELTDRGVDRIVAVALARNDVAAEFSEATGFDRVGTARTTIGGEQSDELVFDRPL